ncbi:hypothetical protein CBW16_00600 [Flavobacteriaceae bacterium JJC]|nr:hypothetical protein CBW16_00600 [Flavobacteriaceae bacterium JJC]
MKNKFIILLLSIFPVLLFSQNNGVEITGWTNVSTFKCTNDNFKNSGSIYSFSGNQLPNVQLQVNDFDCRNKMMTSDFRKTLNSEKYPVLTIKFLNFRKTTANRFSATVEVKMMTVTKKYAIEFSEYNNSLVGNKRLKFSDFNIIPPKKMGGIVYVKDEIDLFFSLAIKD